MEKDNITYEYKKITVSKNLEVQWEDGYEKFGWKLVNNRPEEDQGWSLIRTILAPLAALRGTAPADLVKGYGVNERVELEFKRNKNLPRKNELNRLQGHFENIIGEMEHMEQTKMATAHIGSSACGLLGTICAAMAVLSVISGEALRCIGFAIPGFSAWFLGALVYHLLKGRREKAIKKEYKQKSKMLDDICDEAYILL